MATEHESEDARLLSDKTDGNGSRNSKFFCNSILRTSIGNICGNMGWHSVGSTSLDVLSEVTSRYIRGLGKSCMSYANEASRSSVTLDDVELAFNKHRVNLSELEEYLTTVAPVPFPVKVPQFPARIKPANRIIHGCFNIDNSIIETHGNVTIDAIDTVIGEAVTSSSDEDENDEEDDQNDDENGTGDLLERINMNTLTGSFSVQKKPPKVKEPKLMKRSDYYEPWMPPIVPIILSERKLNESLSNMTMDSCEDLNIDNTSQTAPGTSSVATSISKDKSSNYEVSSLDSSVHLTAVYLNKDGQIISLTGKDGRAPDPRRPPPDSSDEESEGEPEPEPSKPDENKSSNIESSRNGDSMGKIPKLKLNKDGKKVKHVKEKGIKMNIGKNRVSKAKDNLEKIKKIRKNKLLADGSKLKMPKLLSIKVSGLKSGTPTASPKVADGAYSWDKDADEEVDPEKEGRINSTIDDVLAGVGKSPLKDGKKPRAKKIKEPKPKKSDISKVRGGLKKKPISAEIVVEDDDDDEDVVSNNDSNSVFKFVDEPEPTPPKSAMKKSPSPTKSTPSPSRRGRSPKSSTETSSHLSSHRSPGHTSPRISATSTPAVTVGSPSKAAKKLYPPDIVLETPKISLKKEDDEFDAAKILMSMSTTPSGLASTMAGGSDAATSSPFDTSAFNLGKQLASLNPAAAAAAAFGSSSSSLHPFAPPPPPKLPFKTLAEKKAFSDHQSPHVSTETISSKMTEKERTKKEKKDKKKEKKDREKKEKGNKERKSLTTDPDSPDHKANIPKLNIKFSSSKKSKSDPRPSEAPLSKFDQAKNSCILITETVSLETAKKAKSGKRTEGVRETSPKKGKKNKDDDEEEDDGKLWICPGCKAPDDGSPMIGCDSCEEWYHWTCVGIRHDPPDDEDWFCQRCRDKQKKIADQIEEVHDEVKVKKRKKSGGGKHIDDDVEEIKKKNKKDHHHHSHSKHDTESKPQQVKLKEKKKEKAWMCPKCKGTNQDVAMVCCDSCDLWYHMPCVGVLVPPPEEEPWLCPFCRKRKAKTSI